MDKLRELAPRGSTLDVPSPGHGIYGIPQKGLPNISSVWRKSELIRLVADLSPINIFRIKAATDDTKPDLNIGETRVWRLDLQPCDYISYPNISHEEKSTIFHVSWLPKPKMTATKETQKLELTKTTLQKMSGWWFQKFYYCSPLFREDSFWLIFFKQVGSTTN